MGGGLRVQDNVGREYRRNYKSLLPLIDNVKIDEVRSAQYAQAMMIKAQQSYASDA